MAQWLLLLLLLFQSHNSCSDTTTTMMILPLLPLHHLLLLLLLLPIAPLRMAKFNPLWLLLVVDCGKKYNRLAGCVVQFPLSFPFLGQQPQHSQARNPNPILGVRSFVGSAVVESSCGHYPQHHRRRRSRLVSVLFYIHIVRSTTCIQHVIKAYPLSTPFVLIVLLLVPHGRHPAVDVLFNF